MNRRTFLQVAGGMVVGAALGGNAPNPVVLPTRPLTMPEPPLMPTELGYDLGKSAMESFAAGFNEGTIYWSSDGGATWEITHQKFFEMAYWGEEPGLEWTSVPLAPETISEHDQSWEEMHVATLRG